jgi:HlyD family secretion protein
MKKRMIRLIVLAVVVVAVVLGIRWQKNRESSSANGTLKLYGTIDIRDAGLAFLEQERIDQVRVEEGDRVEVGQVLARLKTDRLEAQIREVNAQIAAQQEIVKRLKAGSRAQEIEQARAEVAAAKADVQNADVSYRRIEETSGTGATSDQALDDAKSRLEVTRARLKVAETTLALGHDPDSAHQRNCPEQDSGTGGNGGADKTGDYPGAHGPKVGPGIRFGAGSGPDCSRHACKGIQRLISGGGR